MKQKDIRKELEKKKLIGITDFELLRTPGVIGNYQECELTSIFLIEKGNSKLFHYYAIISYEEFFEIDEIKRNQNITPKLIPINKDISLGITRKRLTLAEGQDIFYQLCKCKLNLHSFDFYIPEDTHLFPKVHVPNLWGYSNVIINKVLKPNLWGDKYILEFHSISPPILGNLINEDDRMKIHVEIKELTKIDLESVNDRVGSFIFQFPITVLSGSASLSDDWCSAEISLQPTFSFSEIDNIMTTVTTKLDDVITGFNCFQGNFSKQILQIGDSNNLELRVFNIEKGLIYISSMANFMRGVNISFGIGAQNSEPRYYLGPTDERVEIDIFSDSIGVGNKSYYYDSRIKQRIIHNEVIKKSGDFLNIKNNERNEAITYVRTKIHEFTNTCNEIWIMDPYLNFNDIFETLYHIHKSTLVLKCITSYQKSKHRTDDSYDGDFEKDFKLFKKNQKKMILEKSNNRGVNLEYRVVNRSSGFNFHDRFLFFIPNDIYEIPTVFSLGTSINRIGYNHHIIQKTLEPWKIIETFKELWSQLQNEESLVIKLPEDKK